MPFARPTLDALITRVRSDFDALFGAIPLPRSVEDGLLRVVAGVAHGLYGRLAWVVAQALPDRSDDDMMLRWARLQGMQQKAASFAVGVAQFAVTGTPSIPVGTQVKHASGAIFEVYEEGLVDPGGRYVGIRALAAGASGNLASAEEVALLVPIAGVTSPGVLMESEGPGIGTAGGAAAETVDQLRERLLARLAAPPRGGGPGDYEAWALELAPTLKAWERPARSGAGTVDVFFVDYIGEPDEMGIPGASRVVAEDVYITARAPVTVTVNALAPTAQGVAMTIALSPDTADIRAAVEAELRGMFFRESEPGATVLVSHIREAISAAEGEVDHVLTTPSADVAATSDAHLPVLGVITWT